ncbi:MAG TPA: hypothetical protein DDY82_02935 [Clostridiales bacterium]|nr:hypothetical protein [Clostridiales bacterium]
MKKTLSIITISSFIICLFLALNFGGKVLAENTNKLKTQPFIPSTYFEYYSLSSPIDVCEDENNVYIAEKNAIIKFDKSLQEYKRFSLPDMTITQIGCYENVVYFLSSSILYKVSPEEFNKCEKVTIYDKDEEANRDVSTCFYISDMLYTNTSSDIVISSFNKETNNFEIKEKHSLGKTVTIAVNQRKGEMYSTLYYFDEFSCYALYRNGVNEKLFDASVSFAQYYNGKIYYVTTNGLFAYSTEDKTTIALTESDENKANTSGFYIFQDRVLICYQELNLIKEFDLRTYEFTGRIVTTYSDKTNRLPQTVKEVVADGDYVYVLTQDSSSITQLMKFSETEKKYYKINADLSFYPKIFAVTGNTIILANGTDAIKILEQGEEENGIIPCEEKYSLKGTNANNVVAVDSFEGDFYIIKNTTVSDSKQYPTIVKVEKTSKKYNINVNSYKYFKQKEGTAKTCTINAFGEIFIMMTNGEIVKYDLINDAWEKSEISIPAEATKIQADFESLYYNLEEKIFNAKTHEGYELEKNKNYGNGNLVSFEFNWDLSKVFFLYEGHLIYTLDLPLKTPNNFEIPVGYGTTLMTSIETTTVNTGAKMYEVEKGNNNYFNYISYKLSNSPEEYVIIDKSENDFLLIANGKTTYIIRKADADITTVSEEKGEYKTGYYLASAGIYSIPQLNLSFKIAQAEKYEKINIEKKYSVGGKEYLLIKRENGQKGFIEKNFIAKEILELTEKTSFKFYECKKTSVYDINGEIIGEIPSGSVAVYSFKDGMYKIRFLVGEDGIGYIPYDAIIIKKDKTIRNTLLLMIVLSAFLITAVYLQNRAKRKRLNNY